MGEIQKTADKGSFNLKYLYTIDLKMSQQSSTINTISILAQTLKCLHSK